ncbi:hypothetical protein RvY_08306-2 [Ramazzottius varieornatus]|uniref:Uncharacterized protein n=1 Tax=Ramazzottius varieornatus TaxID=947166 RepID=A0A1D1V7Q4_RAMVA|nr:hypothetical protein RvY_08306-2 [Ramazzottius varieornatus]
MLSCLMSNSGPTWKRSARLWEMARSFWILSLTSDLQETKMLHHLEQQPTPWTGARWTRDVSSARLSTVPDLLSTKKDYGYRTFSFRSSGTEVELPFDLRNVPNGSRERNNVEKFLRRVDKLKAELQSATDRSNLLQKDKSFLAGRNEYLEKANHDLRTQLATINSRVASLEDGREKLLVDARKIHEKDRAHYLHSFQKVIKKMDSEKMQELNSTIRKQVRSYESQISDLRKQNEALADEKHIFRKESDDLRRKLDAAEVKVATDQSALSQEFTKLQISMAAQTHDYEENKHKLRKALEAIVQLKDQISFLQDRNNIILKQYETLKEETDAEITKLTQAVNEKDARLEAYERTPANSTNLPTSDGIKQSVIDDLSHNLTEVRKELAEKTGLLHGANEKIEQLRAALQSKKDILNRVRKTRDQLYEVVRNDERYAQNVNDTRYSYNNTMPKRKVTRFRND